MVLKPEKLQYISQALTGKPQPAERSMVIKSVLADYSQVRDDLTTALNSRGLVISSVSHVGEMLAAPVKLWGRPGRFLFGPRSWNSVVPLFQEE